MHNLAGRKPHKTSRKKSNRAVRKGVGECGAQGKASPTVNTFGIHLRGHTKLSSNPNGSLVFCCYLFFRVDGAPLFLFFQFSVSVSFSTLSAEANAGQGRAGSIDDDDRAFRGISNFDFNSVTWSVEWQRAASCELRTPSCELNLFRLTNVQRAKEKRTKCFLSGCLLLAAHIRRAG